MAPNSLKKIDYKKQEALKSLESLDQVQSISAPEAEAAVLGAMIIEKDAYHLISGILMPEFFASDDNKSVYSAMVSLIDQKREIDLITVADEIRKQGSHTPIAYLLDLTQKVNSAAHLGFHAHIIVEEWMKRSFLNLCVMGSVDVRKLEADPLLLLDQFKTDLQKIENKAIPSRSQPMNQSIYETLEKVKETQTTGIMGTPWHNPVLDLKTAGMADNELIVVAGLPGAGKTSLMMFTMDAIANHDEPVGGISYEMTKENINHREMSIISGYPYGAIQEGRKFIDFDLIRSICDKNGKRLSNLHFNYSNPTLRGIRIWIKKMLTEFGIRRFFIDFFQKIPLDSPTGDPKIDNGVIAVELKNICRDYNVTIVVLARMNDKAKNRENYLPQEGDIYFGNALESEADTVIYMTRPEQYAKYKESGIYTLNGVDVQCVGKTLLVATKNRRGSTFNAWTNSDVARQWYWGDFHPYPEVAKLHGLEIDVPLVSISKAKESPYSFKTEVIGVNDVLKTNNINGLGHFETPF